MYSEINDIVIIFAEAGGVGSGGGENARWNRPRFLKVALVGNLGRDCFIVAEYKDLTPESDMIHRNLVALKIVTVFDYYS